MYGLYTAFLAGKSSNIRSYTAYIYGSGQPCWCAVHVNGSFLPSLSNLSLLALNFGYSSWRSSLSFYTRTWYSLLLSTHTTRWANTQSAPRISNHIHCDCDNHQACPFLSCSLHTQHGAQIPRVLLVFQMASIATVTTTKLVLFSPALYTHNMVHKYPECSSYFKWHASWL